MKKAYIVNDEIVEILPVGVSADNYAAGFWAAVEDVPDNAQTGWLKIDGAWKPAPPPEFNPGPDYEKRGEDWYKIHFTKKEFLLLCGLDKVAALNAGAKENPMLAAIHDILMASEFIDVTDADTIQLVNLLAGNILSSADRDRILGGLKYEEN